MWNGESALGNISPLVCEELELDGWEKAFFLIGEGDGFFFLALSFPFYFVIY